MERIRGESSELLTIDTRTLRLGVPEGVMWRTRRSTEAGWCLCLHVPWHSWRSLRLWRWRSKTSPTLAGSSHNALEQIRWTMTDGWRRWLRWTGMRAWRSATALFELMSQACYFSFVSIALSELSYLRDKERLCLTASSSRHVSVVVGRL